MNSINEPFAVIASWEMIGVWVRDEKVLTPVSARVEVVLRQQGLKLPIFTPQGRKKCAVSAHRVIMRVSTKTL